MNKNTVTIVWVVVAILVIGGVAYYVGQNSAPKIDNTTATETDKDQTETNQTETQQAGTPFVTTRSNVATTDTTAVLSGAVNPNGAFTNYWYEYGLTSGLDNKQSSLSQSVGSGFASIPAPSYVTGLTKNTTYYFRLVAENQYGRVAGTEYSFLTTQGNPPPIGSIPTVKTVAATGISRTGATLSGEVTPNKASTQFWFEYGKTTDLGIVTTFASVGDGSTLLPASITLTNLIPSTTYYFRINAQNQFGTVNGKILSFKTTGPAATSAPTATTKAATTVNSSGATLRGSVNPNGLVTSYWFEYSTDPIFGPTLSTTTAKQSAGADTDPVSVETNITGLNAKTNYYFRIVSQNALGLVRGERMTFKTK